VSGEQNKEVFRRVIEEGFSKGNLRALDDCFPPRYIEHQFDLPSTLEEFRGSISFLRDTFSPFSLTIEDIVADGDKGLGADDRARHGQQRAYGTPTDGQVICDYRD
jgi:hypothetical protein